MWSAFVCQKFILILFFLVLRQGLICRLGWPLNFNTLASVSNSEITSVIFISSNAHTTTLKEQKCAGTAQATGKGTDIREVFRKSLFEGLFFFVIVFQTTLLISLSMTHSFVPWTQCLVCLAQSKCVKHWGKHCILDKLLLSWNLLSPLGGNKPMRETCRCIQW